MGLPGPSHAGGVEPPPAVLPGTGMATPGAAWRAFLYAAMSESGRLHECDLGRSGGPTDSHEGGQ